MVCWERRACDGRAPAARGGHTCTVVGKSMFVFGGATREGSALNDVAVLDLGSFSISAHPFFKKRFCIRIAEVDNAEDGRQSS